MRTRLILALVVGAITLISGSALGEDFIPVGSEWRWLHPTDGVDPGQEDKEFHKTWHTLDFDDEKWKTGKDAAGAHGGFGYGEEEFKGVDIGTPPADDLVDATKPVKRRTAYFRHAFETAAEAGSLVLKLQRDDGIVVYLDGQEIARDNVGLNDDSYELMAFTTTSGEEETKLREYKLKGPLPAGKHILAISLHNRAGGSSDLRIAEISLAEGKVEEKKEVKAEEKAEEKTEKADAPAKPDDKGK